MENVQRITQAYTQAPWRKQLQLIGTFLLVLVVVAIVAGIYLNITARAAAVGREIQEMQVLVYGYHSLTTELQSGAMPIEELRQSIADLEAQLAYLTSYEVLEARARQLGLGPVDPESIVYMEVDGYTALQPAVMAPPPAPVVVSAAGIPEEFREPLFSWLGQQFRKTSRIFEEVKP
jgi:cell division protein FtsB